MWIIQPLEISIDGKPSGLWRLTATSDENWDGPFGLCDHRHANQEEAGNCPEARERSYSYTGIQPADHEATERAIYEKLREKYEPPTP
jgi:hypothetical protein